MSEINKEALSADRIVSGGLLGICSIAVIQLSAIGELSTSLKDAMYCFAVAIPSLSFTLFSTIVLSDSNNSALFYSLLLGIFGAIIGLFMIFFHISGGGAVVFGIMSLFYMFCFIIGE